MRLFHVGFQEIRDPDIYYGRRNADFGQGFYLSPDKEFSERWAKERKGQGTYINVYELCTEGLRIRNFRRDQEWFDYIFANRAGHKDSLKEFDVIEGPVANDIIYDVMGITTSGFLSREDSLALLQIGPEYRQVVIKTEKAVKQLSWISARLMDPSEIAEYQKLVRAEEAGFQELFAKKLNEIVGE